MNRKLEKMVNFIKNYGTTSDLKHALNKKPIARTRYWQEHVLLEWDIFAEKAGLGMLVRPEFSGGQIMVPELNGLGREVAEGVWQARQMAIRLYEKGLMEKTEVIWVKTNDSWFPAIGNSLEEVRHHVMSQLEIKRIEYERSEEHKKKQQELQLQQKTAQENFDFALKHIDERASQITVLDALRLARDIVIAQQYLQMTPESYESIFNAFAGLGFVSGANVGKSGVEMSEYDKAKYIIGQVMSCSQNKTPCPEILISFANHTIDESHGKY